MSGARWDVDSMFLVRLPFRHVFFFYKKLTNVSCEYDRLVVDTQLCKLRGTSETLIGRACAKFH